MKHYVISWTTIDVAVVNGKSTCIVS